MAKCNFNKSKEVTNPPKVMMEGRTSAKQIYGMVHCSTATGEWQLQQGTGQLDSWLHREVLTTCAHPYCAPSIEFEYLTFWMLGNKHFIGNELSGILLICSQPGSLERAKDHLQQRKLS